MKRTVYINVIGGPEGPCVDVGNDSGGFRLAGPKPWGGGRVLHRFEVDLDELIEKAGEFATEKDQ